MSNKDQNRTIDVPPGSQVIVVRTTASATVTKAQPTEPEE